MNKDWTGVSLHVPLPLLLPAIFTSTHLVYISPVSTSVPGPHVSWSRVCPLLFSRFAAARRLSRAESLLPDVYVLGYF